LDSTRPPQIIVLEVAPCRDSVAASDELALALAPAAAPAPDWKVRVRFARSAGRITVQGEVLSPSDEAVASRTLSNAGADCASLARGVGVWASLVLDAEVERAKATASPSPPPVIEDPLAAPPAARAPTSLWPSGQEPDARSPELEVFLRHSKEERTVELGLTGFVMGGTGGGAVVGASVFGIFEASHGFFLRPALLAGHSVGVSPATEAPTTLLDSRFDACARVPGFYREGRGLQLDLCGGAEVGFSLVDEAARVSATSATPSSQTLPFIGLGPSLEIRGELTRNLAATVRGVGDVSLLRDSLTVAGGTVVTPPVFAGRAEVGLSWTLR
jgi:hypothetical protein